MKSTSKAFTMIFITIFTLLPILPSTTLAGPIPDTGQTQSYTDTFGEDSDYTINPQSYTKLDDQGKELSYTATSWAMVRDNVTGLIWEVKTDDGTIHDRDDTYNWYDAQDVFIQALNDVNFGGFSDWRLPTVKELLFIVNSGRYSPAITIDYFPNTQSSYYWSSTSYASYHGYAWRVHFPCGNVNGDYKSTTYYVRAVRGGQ